VALLQDTVQVYGGRVVAMDGPIASGVRDLEMEKQLGTLHLARVNEHISI